MSRYSEGEWIKYQCRGITGRYKILEVCPDDKLVIGSHDNDPNTMLIDESEVITTIEG